MIDPRLSGGEQLVVCAILDPAAEADAVAALSPTLFGVDGAAADEESGYPRTCG